jgi:Lhr-like helicase
MSMAEAFVSGVTERVVVLMSPKEKARLEARARRARASIGEYVRQSIEAYDPASRVEIEALLRTLRQSHREALAALSQAEAELRRTRDHFAKKEQA